MTQSRAGWSCTAVLGLAMVVVPVYLRLSDGRLLRFVPPTDRCGYPSDEFADFLRSLGFVYAGSGVPRP